MNRAERRAASRRRSLGEVPSGGLRWVEICLGGPDCGCAQPRPAQGPTEWDASGAARATSTRTLEDEASLEQPRE